MIQAELGLPARGLFGVVLLLALSSSCAASEGPVVPSPITGTRAGTAAAPSSPSQVITTPPSPTNKPSDSPVGHDDGQSETPAASNRVPTVAKACDGPPRFCGKQWPADTDTIHCFRPASLKVDSLSPITCLRRLTGLTVNSTTTPNRVKDLVPLTAMSDLEELDLRHSQVEDLTPLAGLSKLRYLNLADTRVLDVEPLSALAELRNLNLWATPLQDIAPLAKLTKLEELHLGWTKVDDLAALESLTQLKSLWLWYTKVVDLGPIDGLTNLESLFLDNTKVSDLSPLANLSQLTHLSLSGTAITDLSPLLSLKNLKTLELKRTQITWAQVAEIQKAIVGLRVHK